MKEESISKEAARDVGAQAETPTRQKLIEVPSRAVQGNVAQHATRATSSLNRNPSVNGEADDGQREVDRS